MSVWVMVLAVLVSLVILSDGLLLVLWQLLPEAKPKANQDLPMISVLLAVRNEATNLPRCLQHLTALDYPKEKLEILIGDDSSKDETKDLAQQWAGGHEQIKVIAITKVLPKVKAKANVIAQLAHQAQGDYLFITDADVAVNPQWIKALLHFREPKVGVVGGTTLIEGTDLWSAWQNLDWLLAQGMLQVANRLGWGLAISGTNMMVTRDAHRAIGGFEEIPHPITEDFGILTAVKANGYQIRNILQPLAWVAALPSPDPGSLLSQRKRWMKGATKLSWPVLGLLYLRGLFWLLIIILSFFMPLLAVILALFKFILGISFMSGIFKKVQRPVAWLALLSFEFYAGILSLATILVHWLPYKVTWKDRTY